MDFVMVGGTNEIYDNLTYFDAAWDWKKVIKKECNKMINHKVWD